MFDQPSHGFSCQCHECTDPTLEAPEAGCPTCGHGAESDTLAAKINAETVAGLQRALRAAEGDRAILLKACEAVLWGLEDMTTEDFQRGADDKLRAMLEAAIARAGKGAGA